MGTVESQNHHHLLNKVRVTPVHLTPDALQATASLPSISMGLIGFEAMASPP